MTDDSFSDTRLDQADTQTVGQMGAQGDAQDHNSGNVSYYGPVGDPSNHCGPPAGGGYDPVP